MGFRLCSCLAALFPLPFNFGIFWCLLSVGLKSVPTNSPVVMSAAQCVMLARSAARAERTETQKDSKTLAKREYSVRFPFLLFLGVFVVSSVVGHSAINVSWVF